MTVNDTDCNNSGMPLLPLANWLNQSVHFRGFKKISVAHPATDWGNRCGHVILFSSLPCLKKDGEEYNLPYFLKQAQKKIHAFFQQHYKAIFKQCPELKAAHGSKSGIMRSEVRENLSILCSALLSSTDLTTFAVQKDRTLTEIYRFINHALAAEGKARRLSSNRFFRTLKKLRYSGLIQCCLPKAKKLANGQWLAAAAKVHFTDRFWLLIGVSNEKRREVQSEAQRFQQLNPSRQEKANEEVFNRQLLEKQLKNAKESRSTKATEQEQAATESIDSIIKRGKQRALYKEKTFDFEKTINFTSTVIPPETPKPYEELALYEQILQTAKTLSHTKFNRPINVLGKPPVSLIYDEIRHKLHNKVYMEAIREGHQDPMEIAMEAFKQLKMYSDEAVYQLGKKSGLV